MLNLLGYYGIFLRNFDEGFFNWLILAKFWLEKYDFNLYKGFFWEENKIHIAIFFNDKF